MNLISQKYWLKSGAYSLFERVSGFLFGFGSFYILVRSLSREDFGIWILFISVSALIEVARYGLVQNAFVRFASTADEKEFSKIANAAFLVNIILSIGSVIFLLVSAKALSTVWTAPELESLVQLYSVVTILLIPFSQYNLVQQAKLEFKGIFYSSFVRQSIFFMFVVFFHFTSEKIELSYLVFALMIGALTGSITSYLFARKFHRFSLSVDYKWVKILFSYGKYVFGTSISSAIFKTIDQMMLGAMLNSVSVALFNTAMRVLNLFEIPLNSMSSIVLPQSSIRNQKEGKGAVKYLYERSVGVILALIIPALVITLIFTEQIIILIAGPNYIDAVPVLRIMCLFSFFFPFGRQFGVILDSIGKAKINFYSILFTTALNIFADYFFIKAYGLIGAAIGTLTAVTISFIINQIILWRVLGVNTLNPFIYAWAVYSEGLKLIKLKMLPKFNLQ